jgi:hypothetical protein
LTGQNPKNRSHARHKKQEIFTAGRVTSVDVECGFEEQTNRRIRAQAITQQKIAMEFYQNNISAEKRGMQRGRLQLKTEKNTKSPPSSDSLGHDPSPTSGHPAAIMHQC